MPKSKLKPLGLTTDGAVVVGKCYQFASTHGLPLEALIEALYPQNIVISWEDYLLNGIKHGEDASNLKSKIVNACTDVMGKEYGNVIKAKLEEITGGPRRVHAQLCATDIKGRPSAVFCHTSVDAIASMENSVVSDKKVLGSPRSEELLLEHKPMKLLAAPSK